MTKFVIAAFAACGLALSAVAVRAADEKKSDGKDSTFTGVLIDSKCGAGKDEAGAAKHPKACTIKCAADHDILLVAGDKQYKLDDKGKDLAKAYLAKADSTKATVSGTLDGETLKATDIKAAGGADKSDKSDKVEKKAESSKSGK